MAKFNLNNFSLISLNIFVLSLLTFCNLTAISTDELIPNPLQGVACAIVDCGEGSCVSSNASIMGFECVCKPGWKKIQIGNLPFPSCLIPNCTINFNCSDASTPPPTPPSLPPPSACDLVWCGDGTCAANGNGHTCQCFPGSANLLDNSSLPCLQQSSLGEDCNELGLVLPIILPPLPPSVLPPLPPPPPLVLPPLPPLPPLSPSVLPPLPPLVLPPSVLPPLPPLPPSVLPPLPPLPPLVLPPLVLPPLPPLPPLLLPPLPPLPLLPPPSPDKSTSVGPTQAPNSSSKLGTLSILLVAAIIQNWF